MYWSLPEGGRRSVRVPDGNTIYRLEKQYSAEFDCNPGTYVDALIASNMEEVKEVVEKLLEPCGA